MFAKVHRPTNTPGVIDNKGSCVKLVEYLEKENEELPKEDTSKFFSAEFDATAKSTVLKKIDNNVSKLTKRDDKYYMLSLNPSHREAQNLIKKCTGKSVDNFNQLDAKEKQLVFAELRDYTRKAMDSYAQNFGRENVQSGKDLVYFAKIETQRKYHHFDKDVKEGKAEKDTQKPGLNLHVHIIVSRKDRSGKVKLSPLAKSRGNSWELNGKQVNRGFNHLKWKEECNNLFHDKYKFTEQYSSSFKAIQENNKNEIQNSNKNPEKEITNVVINKVKSAIKNEMLKGHFSDERNTISKVKTAKNVVMNPKMAIKNMLKNKVKNLLLDKENSK